MNELQNMYYQLRSFRFLNTFNNILATDTIWIKISLGWTNTFEYQPLAPQDSSSIMAIPPDSDILSFQLSNVLVPNNNVIYDAGDLRDFNHNHLFN